MLGIHKLNNGAYNLRIKICNSCITNIIISKPPSLCLTKSMEWKRALLNAVDLEQYLGGLGIINFVYLYYSLHTFIVHRYYEACTSFTDKWPPPPCYNTRDLIKCQLKDGWHALYSQWKTKETFFCLIRSWDPKTKQLRTSILNDLQDHWKKIGPRIQQGRPYSLVSTCLHRDLGKQTNH